jgi:hypothetical protein
LGAKQADEVVAFIHAVRKKYGITKLLDPLTDRPLQPGGEVLAGATPEDRDAAFAMELKAATPIMATGMVDSEAQAGKAKDEVLAVDVRALKIGIPFSRISEDKFHGSEHATLANWIPDVPVPVHFPWAFMFELQDRYIQDPSVKLLGDMVSFPVRNLRRYTLAQQMASYKYRALLVLTHDLRLRTMGKEMFKNAGPVALASLDSKTLPNPFFLLGQFTDQKSDVDFKDFRLPEDVLNKKTGGPAPQEQLKQIRLPAFWSGWLMDQGLQRMDQVSAVDAARMFTDRLWTDGPYPTHNAFMITRKLLTQGFSPEAWNSTVPQHFVLDYSLFLDEDNMRKLEPKDPAAASVYRRFVVNSFMTSLYLLRDELRKTHTKYSDEPVMDQVPTLVKYVADTEPKLKGQANGLGKDIAALYAKATLVNTPPPPKVSAPGLKAVGTK